MAIADFFLSPRRNPLQDFCEREVALNRRLSPNIYLGVVPISSLNGQFTFDEGDEVVEYAVKMKKRADACFPEQLIERDEAVPGGARRNLSQG